MVPIKCGGFITLVLIGLVYFPGVVLTEYNLPKLTSVVVDSIFKKYGIFDAASNSTVLNNTGVDNLLKSLDLGSVQVVCQPNDTECMKNKIKGHREIKDPLLSRKRRGLKDSSGGTVSLASKKAHEKEWKGHLVKCMHTKNFTSIYSVKKPGVTRTDFMNLCPALVQQIDGKVCKHYHKKFPELVDPEGPPTASQTWGYGFLAITICSFLSLGVIAMIPCLKKSFYNVLMSYLVALAVGTLAGDAMLHLIPHAFIEGSNLSAEITVSADQRLRQHYSQVWRAMFVLTGIYLFFCVEQLMKMKSAICGGDSHGHSHDEPMIDVTADDAEGAEVKEVVPAVEGGHGHSHGGDKEITGETKVSSVAWMVVVGDGFHNFSDGLAVGAAFSASISSGVSTTIAIFCHELPHELGDFAILLKAGMTIRQAIVYNLVSTILAYVGLAIGILAGSGELGRHVILCLTAGLFLYISLVDMMGELTEGNGTSSRCVTALCQHLGLLSGIGLMLFISLYEHNM